MDSRASARASGIFYNKGQRPSWPRAFQHRNANSAEWRTNEAPSCSPTAGLGAAGGTRELLSCRIPQSQSRGAPRACLRRRPTRPLHLTQSFQRAHGVSALRRHSSCRSTHEIANNSEVKCLLIRLTAEFSVNCVQHHWICLFMVSVM